jgi:hypothetical protein
LRALPAPPSRSHDQALVDRARKAAAAQRARGEVWERLRASLGEELPASLLSPRGGEIPVRDRYAKNPIYLRALDEARAHWSEFVTVASEIDALVAEAYGVTGEDLEALRAVLVERV